MLFLILLSLALPVLAHSGRTDSSGGHYNRSTGEYHYHHGYSAHQHPDGVCPYRVSATPKPTVRPIERVERAVTSTSASSSTTVKNSSSNQSKNGGVDTFVSIIIVGSLFAIALFVISSLRTTIKNLEKELRESRDECAGLRSRIHSFELKSQEAEEKARKAEEYAKQAQLELSERLQLPSPVIEEKPMIVWITERGTKYHTTEGCCGARTPITLDSALDKWYEKCSKCCDRDRPRNYNKRFW